MNTESKESDVTGPKSSKKPIIVGAVLAILGFAVGYAAIELGPWPDKEKQTELESNTTSEPQLDDLAFVPIPPVIVNLNDGEVFSHLKFSIQLAVPASSASFVEGKTPRISDILNTYLRAVRVEELRKPTSLLRIRSNILRRVQIAVGEEFVKDVLIMEFVIN